MLVPTAPPNYNPDYTDEKQVDSNSNSSLNLDLDAFIERHELSEETKKDLNRFTSDEVSVHLLCDDSGSMETKDCSYLDNGIQKYRSRWSELRETTLEAVALGLRLKCPKLTLSFLNNTTEVYEITNVEKVQKLFSEIKPKGFTPLTDALRLVYTNHKEGTNLLIIIATDGRPSSEKKSEKDSIKEFRKVLKDRDTKHIGIQILACTDDEETMEYLDKWDRQVSHLDVTDDFTKEKNQLRKYGNSTDRGTYIVKCFLGGWFRKWDKKDEPSKCIIL